MAVQEAATIMETSKLMDWAHFVKDGHAPIDIAAVTEWVQTYTQDCESEHEHEIAQADIKFMLREHFGIKPQEQA